MSGSAPSDDDIRLKAYELWQAGGRRHGADQEDWFRASDLLCTLTESVAKALPSDQAPGNSISDLVSEKVQSVTGLVTEAASVIAGFFGSHDAAKKPLPKDAAPQQTPFEEALSAHETVLEVERHARMRQVKTEAATSSKVAGEAKKPANPDG